MISIFFSILEILFLCSLNLQVPDPNIRFIGLNWNPVKIRGYPRSCKSKKRF